LSLTKLNVSVIGGVKFELGWIWIDKVTEQARLSDNSRKMKRAFPFGQWRDGSTHLETSGQSVPEESWVHEWQDDSYIVKI
jgi:hypothetical protein